MENVKMIERKFIKQLKGIIFFPFKLVFLPFILVFCVVIYFLKKVTQEILYFLRIEERPINLYPPLRWGDFESEDFESYDKEVEKKLNFLDLPENK